MLRLPQLHKSPRLSYIIQRTREGFRSVQYRYLARLNLLLSSALAGIALRLWNSDALFNAALLLQVVLNANLRRNSVGFVLAERVLGVRVPALGVGACNAVSVAIYNTLVDFVALLVYKASAGLVARGERDFAFHGFDLLLVQEFAVLIAELDLLLGDGAIGLNLLLTRSEVDILLWVVCDGRGRANVGLRSGSGAWSRSVLNGILRVL